MGALGVEAECGDESRLAGKSRRGGCSEHGLQHERIPGEDEKSQPPYIQAKSLHALHEKTERRKPRGVKLCH